MRWYPAASSFFTAATNSSSESLIPTETPEAISSRVPPIIFHGGTPFFLASASQVAASSAPLAILWPRTGSSRSQIFPASEKSLPATSGQRCWCKMCQAVSVVSGLYDGVSPATHSPHPVTPSTFASTSTIRRSSVRIVLVSNGATSFILNSRSVISFTRIFPALPLQVLEIAPRRQQIRRAGVLVSAHRDGGIFARKPLRELLAHPRLHGLHSLRVAVFPLLQFFGHFDGRGGLRHARRQVLDGRHHARRIQPPLRQHPGGRDSAMQRARRDSVKIRNITPANRAQPVQIKMGVLQLQRIKCPFHQANAPSQGFVALKQFQHPPHAAIAIRGAHPGLVRVQI